MLVLGGAEAMAAAPAEAPPSAPAEITVSSQVDKVKLTTEEPLTFSVTITGPIKRPPRVTVSSFKGFQVITTGQSQQVNIREGQMQLAITLQYLLAPLAAGTYTLGPVVVEHEGKRYETAPIPVEVVGVPGRPAPEAPAPETSRRPLMRGGTVL